MVAFSSRKANGRLHHHLLGTLFYCNGTALSRSWYPTAQQVSECGLVTLHKCGLAAGTLIDSTRYLSRIGRAVANSYTVHSSTPEQRAQYRFVCASCSRDIAFHVKLQLEAASCHGQIAVLR